MGFNLIVTYLNLTELEEKLGKAYDVKEREVDTKYNGMTGKVAEEAKKAWGLVVK